MSPPKSATVALDAVGGEGGLGVTVGAALSSLHSHPDLSLVLVGPEDLIRGQLGDQINHPRLQIQHAAECVEMDESPASALRFKKGAACHHGVLFASMPENGCRCMHMESGSEADWELAWFMLSKCGIPYRT